MKKVKLFDDTNDDEFFHSGSQHHLHVDTGTSSSAANTPLFSPLQGNEEQIRLEQKFHSLDDDINEETGKKDAATSNTFSRQKKEKTTAKRKLLEKPAPSSRRRINPRKHKVAMCSSKATPAGQRRPCTDEKSAVNEVQRSPVSSELGNHSSSTAGFDEVDLEKPHFDHVTAGPKTSLRLSDEDSGQCVEVPATINRYLRDYQRAGVQFFYNHYAEGEGALLADDMGLGKTIQVISFMAAILGKTGTKTDIVKLKPRFIRKLSSNDEEDDEDPAKRKVFLIIGPATILQNWMDELQTWGYFAVGKYHGAHKAHTISDLRQHRLDVVVTTFTTCRDHINEINSFHWDAVFADEAHQIKGLKAETSKALRLLCCRRRFALSGTPLQNALIELWSILDWTNPGCLGDLCSFQKMYIQKIELGQKQDATKRELAEARKAQEQLQAKRNKYMLRRTKKLIANELPHKDELIVHCEPTKLQCAIYRSFLECDDIAHIIRDNEPCDCGSGIPKVNCCHKVSTVERNKKSMALTFMHLLLKTANHIALLLPEHTNNARQEEYASAICRKVLATYDDMPQKEDLSLRILSEPKYSGKMKVLHGLLSIFWKERSKVLIFSYSTRLLDIMEQYVMGLGHDYRRLDGSTNQSKRGQLVGEFNRDPNIFVFLISTLVGGLGLNLTGANRVIIFDPNWNPTHDLQAQDRAFRIGQQRDVKVFRLISSGMIEENIYLRQIYKQQLSGIGVSSENSRRYFRAVRGQRDNCGELFGIANMFRLRDKQEASLTQQILMRNEQIESELRVFQVSKYIKPLVKTPEEMESMSSSEESPSFPDSNKTDSSDDDTSTSGDDKTSIQSRMSHKRGHRTLGFCHSGKDKSSSDGSDNDDATMSKFRKMHAHNTLASRRKCVPLPLDESEEEDEEKEGFTGLTRNSAANTTDQRASTHTRLDRNSSSIDNMLVKCGVRYVHDNRSVIGASRAEDHMTKCAMEAVFENHVGSQLPARMCAPYIQDREDNEEIPCTPEKKKNKKKKADKSRTTMTSSADQHRSVILGNTHVLIGQTPKAIRHHQMAELCEWLQEPHKMALAKRILTSSRAERRRMLKEFYVHRNPQLEAVFTEDAVVVTGHDDKEAERKTDDKKQSRDRHVKFKQRAQPLHNPLSRKGCQYTDNSTAIQSCKPPATSVSNSEERDIKKQHASQKKRKSSKHTSDIHGISRTAVSTKADVGRSVDEKQQDLDENNFDAMLDEIFGLGTAPTSQKRRSAPVKLSMDNVCSAEKQNKVENPHDIVDDIFFDEVQTTVVRKKSVPKRKSTALPRDSAMKSLSAFPSADSRRDSPY